MTLAFEWAVLAGDSRPGLFRLCLLAWPCPGGRWPDGWRTCPVLTSPCHPEGMKPLLGSYLGLGSQTTLPNEKRAGTGEALWFAEAGAGAREAELSSPEALGLQGPGLGL